MSVRRATLIGASTILMFASLAPLFNRQDFEFSARGNGITDVSPFAGVANWVDLRDNAITDLSPLAGVNWGSYDLRGNPLDVDLSLWTLTLLCMFDDDVAVVWGGAPHVYGCERTDYTGS